jgi:hypothetical protein
MKGKFNNFSVVSIYTLAQEENELVNDPCYDKLNQIYQRIEAHCAKIVVGYFTAKIGREGDFKPVTGNWGLHEIKKTQGARQRKYVVKMFKVTEIMRIYTEEIRKGITENSEQQNNQNEETSETRWKKLRRW